MRWSVCCGSRCSAASPVTVKKFATVAAAVAAFGFANAASAADMPAKAPVYKAPVAIVEQSNYYFWLDGMYDRVRLPTYQLGYHNTAPAAPFTDVGAVQTFDPGLNGSGVRGGIGYVISGTSTKFEFGGSYVAAKANQSQSTSRRARRWMRFAASHAPYRSCSRRSPIQSAGVSLWVWPGPAAISQGSHCSSWRSRQNSWNCSSRSRRASRLSASSTIRRILPPTSSGARSRRARHRSA